MIPNVRILIALLLLQSLTGCVFLPKRTAADTKDRDFTHYTPVDASSGKLRVAVKDLIDMKGYVTTAGSKYLATHGTPAPRDAKCLAGVRRPGVEIVGRTNVTEFAITVSGINEYFGTPRNRLGRKGRFIPGGSSSGSAVAVATGKADVSLGTDTAGSIRVPAACCGVVGLKTTYGLIPLDGVYPISPKHLDTVGPIARTIDDTATGMDLLKPGFRAQYRSARRSAFSITVGRLHVRGIAPEVDEAVDRALLAAGFRVVELDDRFRESWEQAEKDGRTIALGDAWRTDQYLADKPGVSVVTKAVIALGRIEFATSYEKAVLRKRAWQRTLEQTFRHVDIIAVPTLKDFPPKVPMFGFTPAFEARVFGMQNTVAVNFAGNPALAMPVPANGRNVRITSIQLIGPRNSEARLLNAGRLIERAVGTADQFALRR